MVVAVGSGESQGDWEWLDRLAGKSPPSSIPVVRDARQDGVRAIDLLKREDKGHFVLEGERAQRPEKVGGLSHALGKPICPANQERTRFSWISLDAFHLFSESAAGQLFPTFIEDDAKATFAATKQLAAFAERIGGFDMRSVYGGEAP